MLHKAHLGFAQGFVGISGNNGTTHRLVDPFIQPEQKLKSQEQVNLEALLGIKFVTKSGCDYKVFFREIGVKA